MKKETITAVIYLLIILFAFGMILLNAKEVRFSMLVGYKDLLPEKYDFFDILKASAQNTENRIDIITRRMPLIDWYGGYKRLIGSRIMQDADPENTVYKMNNGQLTFIYPQIDVQQYVDNIVELNEYLAGKNMEMIYIQAPLKIDKFNPQLPIGISDMSNTNADAFLKGLFERDVPYYDLREVIHEFDLQYDDLFYDTDHHWKVETAFWAYTQVSKMLKENYGININPETISPENFSFINYKNCYLGSQGKRTGKYYSGVDDFTLVLPLFETDYHVISKKNEDEIYTFYGSFHDTIIDNSLLDMNPQIGYSRYACYFGDYTHPKIEVTNNKVEDGSALIIIDSFGQPFSAFMSLNFHQTDILDLRYFKEQTLFQYLENKEYDIILFVYNPSALDYSIMFTFK